MLLNRRFRGRAVFRLLFFLPYVLSEAVTGIVFRLLLQPDSLRRHGAVGRSASAAWSRTGWATPSFVMVTMFVIISWKYFGFHMILLLAGLQGIPQRDRGGGPDRRRGPRQAFRHVTLPLLGPTLRVSVFLSIIGALQLFDMVWVMTGGGPLNASNTMAISMFKSGFTDTRWATAAPSP